MKKPLFAFALFSVLASTSCIGPNNACNGIGAWNTHVTGSKWGNELVYVGLWVIPVYEIAFTLDSLVFNAFEFWGGNNPIGTPGEYEHQGKM